MWPRSSAVSRYAFALLSVAAAFACVSLLGHLLQAAPPVSLFLCAIIFVAWFAGLGPALAAALLSVLAFGYFYLLPINSLTLASRDLPRIALFGVAAVFIASVSAAQKRTAASFRRARDQLQDAVEDLKTLNEQLLLENAERKAAEQKTRQAERELQATIDMIPAMVARYRHDGSYDFVNRTWQDYTGLSQDSVRGGSRARIIHPDDLPLLEDAWRAHLATGEPFEMEHRVRRADGAYRWHWTRRVALRDDNGEVVKWYGVGLDVHDQKEAENSLRRSEARLAEARRDLQLTVDTIPALVGGYRPDGVLDFVNQTWRNYTGLSLDDIEEDGRLVARRSSRRHRGGRIPMAELSGQGRAVPGRGPLAARRRRISMAYLPPRAAARPEGPCHQMVRSGFRHRRAEARRRPAAAERGSPRRRRTRAADRQSTRSRSRSRATGLTAPANSSIAPGSNTPAFLSRTQPADPGDHRSSR